LVLDLMLLDGCGDVIFFFERLDLKDCLFVPLCLSKLIWL
jgi:hypothetical protein